MCGTEKRYRDIEIDKFTKPILRYVAPSFHFDNLKLLDDESGSSEDEKPKKIVTKNSKNKKV